MSGSTTFVATTVAGLPFAATASAAAVATFAASWPDDVEKHLRIKHRTLSHYPLLQLVVFTLPVLAAIQWLPTAVTIVAALAAAAWFGCFMHSCADAMTIDPRGIRLLWPWPRGYHLLPRSLRVRVDSKSTSERVFFVIWSALVLCFIYVEFRPLISA